MHRVHFHKTLSCIRDSSINTGARDRNKLPHHPKPTMSNDTASKHHVYVIGLRPSFVEDSTPTPYGTWADLEALIDRDLARAKRNGFPITVQKLDGRDLEPALALFEKQLTELKDEVGGLLIGTGIRTSQDVLPFERMLGIAFRVLGERVSREGLANGREGPEGVRIMLNDGPDKHCWAIERGFGVKMEVD